MNFHGRCHIYELRKSPLKDTKITTLLKKSQILTRTLEILADFKPEAYYKALKNILISISKGYIDDDQNYFNEKKPTTSKKPH